MTKEKIIEASWTKALDALESFNPKAFEYFYHFHSTHGLQEDDISPHQRLLEIEEHSSTDYLQLQADLISSLCFAEGIKSQDSLLLTADEQGISLETH